MSEGSWVPKAWTEAVPYIVWGILVFAFGFEGVGAFIHGEWWPAAIGFGGMVGLTAMLIHWARVRQTFSDVRWLIAAMMLALGVVTLSPFVEQQRWPFASWVAPPTPRELGAGRSAAQSITLPVGAMSIGAPPTAVLSPVVTEPAWEDAIMIERAFLPLERPCTAKLTPISNETLHARNVLSAILRVNGACDVLDENTDQVPMRVNVDAPAPKQFSGLIVRWHSDFAGGDQLLNRLRSGGYDVEEGHVMPDNSPHNLIMIEVGRAPWKKTHAD